ncbi:MAG: hypothetical protein ACLP9L_29705 [Thermoguttaceae bacterium]
MRSPPSQGLTISKFGKDNTEGNNYANRDKPDEPEPDTERSGQERIEDCDDEGYDQAHYEGLDGYQMLLCSV